MDLKRLVFAAVFAVFAFGIFAQEKPDALGIYRRARDFEGAGNTTEATRLYNQALEILNGEIAANPKNIDSLLVASWVLFRLKRYQESVDRALAGLKVHSGDSRLMESAGESYFYLDKYESSKHYFQKYLEVNPNGDRAATAFFFLGEIFRLTRKYQHADIAYGAALRKSPNSALWWYRLGLARENGGNKAGAKAAYERALRLQPNYENAKAGLARVS